MPKLLKLLDYEDACSPLAETLYVYGLQCKEANTLLSSLGCF